MQQIVAVIGLALATAALVASVSDRRAAWAYLTAGAVVTFVVWQIGTQVAANANC